MTDRPTGAPVMKIKITDQMVESGKAVFDDLQDLGTASDALVRGVFRAMLEAHSHRVTGTDARVVRMVCPARSDKFEP